LSRSVAKSNCGALYLDALSDLVAVYEDEDFQPDAPTDAELLSHLMEARGVNQATLANDLDVAKSTVCDWLSGRRDLSRRQVMIVAKYFHVEPAAFMRATRDDEE
jgi:HTH-type transcriptional regulator / antitoxin HigA